MEIVIIGSPPPLDSGPLNTVYDPLDPDYSDPINNTGDWFGDLMREAGFDDNMYFTSWNEAAQTHAVLDSWEVQNGTTTTKGERFMISVRDQTLTTETTLATVQDGGMTWMTKFYWNGQEAGTIVQYGEGTYWTVRATDAKGNVWEDRTYTNFRLNTDTMELEMW